MVSFFRQFARGDVKDKTKVKSDVEMITKKYFGDVDNSQ